MDPRVALPSVAVGLTVAWILWGAHASGPLNLILLVGALSAHAILLMTSRSSSPLSMRCALTVVGGALVLMALLPLHHSRDLYLYDIYGRIVATHHLNPYVTTPGAVGSDPVVGFVAGQWHQQQSMYGPVFVAIAAVVSTLAGTSELLIRLFWQTVMAGSAFGAAVLVGRRTRDPVAVLALGCSPMLLLAVNDAHNDVLIGLALLGTVLLVDRGSHRSAGLVAAFAVATKLPVTLPVLAVLAWIAWRRGPRSVVQFLGPFVAVITAAYLAVGGRAALVPLRVSAGDDSRFALWQPLRNRDFEALISQGVSRQVVLETVRNQMSLYALVLLLICVVIALWRFRWASRPSEGAVIVGLVLLITATYVMPWYPAMILPIAMLTWRSRASVLVYVQSAFLLVAYADGPGIDPTTGFGQLLEQRAMWINLVLLVAALTWAAPWRRDTTRPEWVPRIRAEVAARVGAGRSGCRQERIQPDTRADRTGEDAPDELGGRGRVIGDRRPTGT